MIKMLVGDPELLCRPCFAKALQNDEVDPTTESVRGSYSENEEKVLID